MAYTAITLAQLRARLQEYWEQTPFWSIPEANNAINEALLTWNMLTGRWKSRMVMETTPNNPDYGLDTPILYRTRLLFNGLTMDVSPYEALMAARPRWMVETTASGGDVPTRPTIWCPISLRTILIWPADAVGHNSLTIDGVANTPVLTNDADFVDLSEADVSVLLPFALHVASFKKGGQWFAQTSSAYALFLKAAGEENNLITTTETYRRYAGLTGRDSKPLADASMPSGLQVQGQ